MRRPRVPKALPLTALGMLILGIIATQVVPSVVTPEQLAKNVLIAAIPFVLIFVGILLFYITLIVIVASSLNDVIGRRPYGIIMWVIIGGILLGIIGMMQPWTIILYTLGFVVLFIALLSYILWSHVSPQTVVYQADEMDAAPNAST